MKRTLVAVAAAAIALAMAGCSSGGAAEKPTSATTPASSSAATPEASRSLDGTWESESDESTGEHEANVKDGTITIYMVNDAIRSLYWKGTAPTSASEGWTSKGDVAALSKSITGSQDETKNALCQPVWSQAACSC